MQVPSFPLTLQDWQGPAHEADSQHTPSTQFPEAQAEAKSLEQPLPLPRPLTEYSQVSSVANPLRLLVPPKSTMMPRLES
jgi:hypothetical protein